MIGHCRSPRMNSMREAELLIMRMQCAKYLDSKTSQWCRSSLTKLEKYRVRLSRDFGPVPRAELVVRPAYRLSHRFHQIGLSSLPAAARSRQTAK